MPYAVIQSGGKQYLVKDGDTIRVDKLATAAGQKVNFAEVLLTATEATITLGAPFIKGAAVEGTVVRQGRYPKVFGVKMKPKKRQRKYFGHKQHFTEVAITKISS